MEFIHEELPTGIGFLKYLWKLQWKWNYCHLIIAVCVSFWQISVCTKGPHPRSLPEPSYDSTRYFPLPIASHPLTLQAVCHHLWCDVMPACPSRSMGDKLSFVLKTQNNVQQRGSPQIPNRLFSGHLGHFHMCGTEFSAGWYRLLTHLEMLMLYRSGKVAQKDTWPSGLSRRSP